MNRFREGDDCHVTNVSVRQRYSRRRWCRSANCVLRLFPAVICPSPTHPVPTFLASHASHSPLTVCSSGHTHTHTHLTFRHSRAAVALVCLSHSQSSGGVTLSVAGLCRHPLPQPTHWSVTTPGGRHVWKEGLWLVYLNSWIFVTQFKFNQSILI